MNFPFSELLAWESERNNARSAVKWHFTNKNARIRLASLYPELD